MQRQRKNAGIRSDEKRKAAHQLKETIKLEEINQKKLIKEGRLKRYQDRIKQYRKKLDIPKQRMKFRPVRRRVIIEDPSTTGFKGCKTILE